MTELYIIQDDDVKGRVTNLQAAIAILATLAATTPNKDVIIKENNKTVVLEYKAGSPQ